jgi:hypothetical protein
MCLVEVRLACRRCPLPARRSPRHHQAASSTTSKACATLGLWELQQPRDRLPGQPSEPPRAAAARRRAGREEPQAGRLVRDARRPGDEHQDQHAAGQEGARGRDGVPAGQPPARLPHLRPGRRVRPPGPGASAALGLALPGPTAARQRQPQPAARHLNRLLSPPVPSLPHSLPALTLCSRWSLAATAAASTSASAPWATRTWARWSKR